MTQFERLLSEGDVEIEGRLPWSSNYTFLVNVVAGDEGCSAVYKPVQGERPLWDFPEGLHRREAAAYLLSEAMGLGIVPETVVRHDCPLGPGSLQRWVAADFSEHYFTMLEDDHLRQELKTIAAFDLLANNADRKGGHCILGDDGRVWAIDHGLCFHSEPKLRTVMWDFAGEKIPTKVLEAAGTVGEDVPEGLADLLDGDELEALARRARSIVRSGKFPSPHPGRRPYPWPLV